jgi:hypothetical protein
MGVSLPRFSTGVKMFNDVGRFGAASLLLRATAVETASAPLGYAPTLNNDFQVHRQINHWPTAMYLEMRNLSGTH